MCCPESMLLFRKAPGSKPPSPIGDWGLGQCQGIKNSQTSSTKTPPTPSLPSTVPLLLLFYVLLALSLGQSVCVVLIPRSVTAELHAASFCVVSLTPLYLFIAKASRISIYTFQPSWLIPAGQFPSHLQTPSPCPLLSLSNLFRILLFIVFPSSSSPSLSLHLC